MFDHSSKLAAASDLNATVDPEKYVRESFTWRPMASWQVWSLTVISAILWIAAIISAVV